VRRVKIRLIQINFFRIEWSSLHPARTTPHPRRNFMTLSTLTDSNATKHWQARFTEHPVWGLGFRPFYILAAAFAALAVPLWLARYFGMLSGLPNVNLNWHLHEMVFGFALAVIIGFLYTAGRNWSGLWTPRRAHLAMLVVLWAAGRCAMLFATPVAAAVVDLAFLPLAAWPFYRVLQRVGNKRNFFLVGLLLLLVTANAVYHAAVLGWIAASPLSAVEAAILVIVMIESVIGSRIIPGFTANAVPGIKPALDPRLDRISIGLTAVTCIAWVAGLAAPAVAALAFATALSQAIRIAGWRSLRTLHNPLLWILHVSYAWIPLGFFMLGLSRLHVVTASAAFHALAVGSMAGLIVGMITRTALGHTGRALKSGRAETAMYMLIQIGAVARVFAAMQTGSPRTAALVLSATCWSIAFLVYLAVYGPYLFGARIDGKEG
jgi:uncharacterized protein involved in response to NO